MGGCKPKVSVFDLNGKVLEMEKRKILGKYVSHLILGGAVFAIIVAFACVLDIAVSKEVHGIGGPDVAIGAMRSLVVMLLIADVACLFSWVAYSTYKVINELFQKAKPELRVGAGI